MHPDKQRKSASTATTSAALCLPESTYVEYRLLSLRHSAGAWRRGVPRAHVGTEGQLLHGSGTVLGHSPTVLLLERPPKDGTRPAGSAMRAARTAGATGAVAYLRKDLVLAGRRGSRAALLGRPASFAVQRPAKASRRRRRAAANWQRLGRASVVGEEATGARDGVGYSRCDGLVDREGAGAAVMGSRGWVWFAVLAIRLISLAVSVAFTFTFTFTFPFSSRKVVLMVGAMALLVHVAVAIAVEATAAAAAAAMQRLVVHSVGLLEASARRLVPGHSRWKRGDMELEAKSEGGGGMGARQRQRRGWAAALAQERAPAGSKMPSGKGSSCLQLKGTFS